MNPRLQVHVNNFMEVLDNLDKSILDKDDLKQIGKGIFDAILHREQKNDEDWSEVMDEFRLIAKLASGYPVCFSCGANEKDCDCIFPDFGGVNE